MTSTKDRVAASRARAKSRGLVQVALMLPAAAVKNIDKAAKAEGVSRSVVVANRLKKPASARRGYTPEGQAEIKRLIALAGTALRQTKSQAAKATINELMEGIADLAGRV